MTERYQAARHVLGRGETVVGIPLLGDLDELSEWGIWRSVSVTPARIAFAVIPAGASAPG